MWPNNRLRLGPSLLGNPASATAIYVLMLSKLPTAEFEITDAVNCSVVACKNGGNCVQEVKSTLCACSPGFAGARCEAGQSVFVDGILKVTLLVFRVHCGALTSS